MRAIHIDDSTYDRLLVAARLMNRTIGEVVTELVDRLASDVPRGSNGPPAASTPPSRPGVYKRPAQAHVDPTVDWIPICKNYKGHQLDGAFNPHTHEVRLATEPWRNKVFPSPTAAAVAVVDHFSGAVRESPNTNGRKFWKVVATGKNLHSIIGER